MTRTRCGFEIRTPFGGSRYCANFAHWRVDYTTPDDGKSMRHRAIALRCTIHSAETFLPRGATQITTTLLDLDEVPA